MNSTGGIGAGISGINGVPANYRDSMSNGESFLIAKGQLNKMALRPCVFNEHVESSRQIQSVVTASNIVMQSIKISQDNINCIGITMESNDSATIDDFDVYANSSALQAVWIETTNPALLETIISESGKSMNIPLYALNDEWIKTISSTDYTNYTFNLSYFQDLLFGLGGAEVSFFIGDGSFTKSLSLVINNISSWEHFNILENSMSDDGGSSPNMSAKSAAGGRPFHCRPEPSRSVSGPSTMTLRSIL